MEQLIKTLSGQLGITEDTVRNSLKVILQFAQKQVPGTDFAQLMDKIPGASALLTESAAEGVPGGPGGLLGVVGSLLGGQSGEAARAFSGLQAAGLPTGQIAPFLQAFVEKARDIAGPEVVDGVLKHLPALQGFLKS